MVNTEKEIGEKLEILQNKVSELILFFKQDLDFNNLVNTSWSAKDVLGHLTFWHESFAKNLKDLYDSKVPNPLKGKLSEVNLLSVESNREISIDELLTKLEKAQNIISNCIGDVKIKTIPYKKGSRDYTRLEHLEIVTHHIDKHLKALNKKLTK